MALSDVQLMRHLGTVEAHEYGVHVWQWLPGAVSGHSTDSLHYKTFPGRRTGRAFDAYGRGVLARVREARFARHLRRTHKARLTECIYNGRFTKVSIKNGRDVPYSYWGKTTWDNHRTHVHVAI